MLIKLFNASSIVFENCNTSRKAYVHGLPNLVIVSDGPPRNLYDTPILALEYPVNEPRKPAQAMFANGTEPYYVG